MIILDMDMSICLRCSSEGKTKWLQGKVIFEILPSFLDPHENELKL